MAAASLALPRFRERVTPCLPLESGDRMSREEFHRRYEAMPELKKAELIKGVVYVSSPARLKKHGKPHIALGAWLRVYEAYTPGVESAADATTILEEESEPQPDAMLRIKPEYGGQSGTTDDDYIEGAPELTAEAAASSASYDLHDKLDAYRESGVREYIVWRVYDGEIDWFAVHGKRYVKLKPGPDGVVRSKVFPGLWLDVAAMLRDDMAEVLRRLQEGLNSPEHEGFVKKLANRYGVR